MKKNRKKKWLGFALVLTIIAVGAASLTAFGADGRGDVYQSQMQQKQTICPIDQDCFQRGVHHTGRSSSAASQAAPAAASTGASTSAATTYGNCRYPDCDGTHANHQNYNYGNHNYGHHGSSHGGGHHGGWHE